MKRNLASSSTRHSCSTNKMKKLGRNFCRAPLQGGKKQTCPQVIKRAASCSSVTLKKKQTARDWLIYRLPKACAPLSFKILNNAECHSILSMFHCTLSTHIKNRKINTFPQIHEMQRQGKTQETKLNRAMQEFLVAFQKVAWCWNLLVSGEVRNLQ